MGGARPAAQKLTHPSKGVYGMAMEGGSYTEGVHFAFIFGKQHNTDPFDSSGKPTSRARARSPA